MFAMNAWYVAALPDEVSDKPLGRKICNKSLVFYRDADRRVVALDDFCPHRGAPLSLGRVCDGKLVCGYHGLEMGCDGKTIAMPGQRVRGFPPVRAFPCIEKHGFIWLWPGDAEQADEAKIPHLEWSGQPDWAFGGGVMHVNCDYRLMVDNLMDLTHERYVHESSIGQKELDETAPTTKVDGNEVFVSRFMSGVMPPPFWRAALRYNGLPEDQPVDRWQICRFVEPSNVLIQVGVAPLGKGGHEADPSEKASGIVVDLLTPETDGTMWYFWGLARHFRASDAALTASIRENQGKIFMEDVAMLEGQHRNLADFPERKLLMLNTDAGGVQARRVIERLVAAEQGSPKASQPA
jgi:vanillate O-demethylase monooxygenase subunit